MIKIGVLGGIGPEATGIFYLKLISKLQNEDMISRNEDFPQIFINSVPAPELIFDKINNANLEKYIGGLKELDMLRPDFILMVCNTIHLFHKELQTNITTELVDLREQVRKKIEESGIKKITVLGTPSTISSGLYNFKNLTYLNPTKEEIRTLSDAVFNFNKGSKSEVQVVENVAKKYISLGSELIVLGCTEFAVMLEHSPILKLNTIDVLVEFVIKRIKNNKNQNHFKHPQLNN